MDSKRYCACVDESAIENCVRVINVTVCMEPRFVVGFRQPPFTCCYELVTNGTDMSTCDFEKAPNPASVLLLSRHIATFFSEPTRVDLHCSKEALHTKWLHGSTVFADTCALSTAGFHYEGLNVRHKDLKAPEFVGHRIPTPGNLSYLTIPRQFKFTRVEKLVHFQDGADKWHHFMSDGVKAGLILGLVGVVLIVVLVLVVWVAVKQRKRAIRRVMVPPVIDEVPGNMDCKNESVKPSEAVQLNIVHTSAH